MSIIYLYKGQKKSLFVLQNKLPTFKNFCRYFKQNSRIVQSALYEIFSYNKHQLKNPLSFDKFYSATPYINQETGGLTDKKKTKFSSNIRKSRRGRLQSHILLTASSYMTKYLRISSYIRKPFLIYDFATAPM